MRKKVNKKEVSPPSPLLSSLSSLNELLFDLFLQGFSPPSLWGGGLGRGFVFLVLPWGEVSREASFLSHLLAE